MEGTVRLDTDALLTLAHPLRSRLLSALRRDGPATATELAEQLDTNTGATSYHLRRLEAVGLVEDTGDGAGRRRLWRASTRGHSYVPSDFAQDPDASAAVGWLSRHYAEQMAQRVSAWLDARDRWPVEWQDACGTSDDAVTVTPAQAEQLAEELQQLVARYRGAGADDPTARRVTVWTVLAPTSPEELPQ